MPTFARGAAFLDRSGAVIAANDGFAALLGLAPGDPGAALRARAEASPALRALVAGEGPDAVAVPGPDGVVELERVATPAGTFLVALAPPALDWLEEAMRSRALTRVAPGLAHDVKNPLNAMALQIALLAEKLSGSDDASASAAPHLAALRDQIGKVNEVVRRFLDVADPSAPLGDTDAGALLADTAALFGHEVRRRRIALEVDAVQGAVLTRCEPGRVGRIVLGIFARALAGTPDGGRLAARAAAEDPGIQVVLEHAVADSEGEPGYDWKVASAAARALGGALSLERVEDGERISLDLPGNGPE